MFFIFKKNFSILYLFKNFLFILCIILFLLFLISKNLNINKGNYKAQKVVQDLEQINKWINICKKKKLIRGILKSSERPKITALITIFNSNKYINTAIKSVQNQLFADVEILLVDDCSTDKSLSIIRNLKYEDKRIKIIQNKKNRGALYSKSIGILKARGKYIMILDSDDLFANENIFNICFNQITQNNIDIIEFSGYNLNLENFKLNKTPSIPFYLRYKHNNEFILQPELSSYIYKKLGKIKYKLIDGFLWGKCIKSAIFQMALKIVDIYIYHQKINYGDDRIINFILFKVANSFKFINEYGIIYNYNKDSITHKKKYINTCHDELINIMSIYNYTKNTRESEIAAFEIIHRWKNIIFPGLNLNNLKYLINLMEKILLNKYICLQKKRRILYFYYILNKKKRLKLI